MSFFFFNITTNNNNYMCILVFIIDGGSGVALFRGKVYRTAGHCKSQLDYVQSATKIFRAWPLFKLRNLSVDLGKALERFNQVNK